jgi:hypothetical protein
MLLLACSDAWYTGPARPAPSGTSRAYGLWVPGPGDTCPASVHDSYSTVGPDGKRYPTWHPPADPASGCSFGHEHGRDPRGSALYSVVGDIPFGYANEVLESYDPLNPRNEDHVGHKVEWENNFVMHLDGAAASSLLEVRCDALIKLHQGTHSRDAFTNNLHELVYHIRCSDGVEMHITMMSAIGDPGQFVRSCDHNVVVQVGPATPANSPQGGGARIIPDRACVDAEILVVAGQQSDFNALHESWETSNSIRTPNGHELAFFNPYFQVRRPSRFYDAAAPNVTGRPILTCYEVDSIGGRRARGAECDDATQSGSILGLTFDDPRSPFDGSGRFVDINYNHVRNEHGPMAWFTDPFGRQAQPDSFPGSIRQFLSPVNNDRGGLGNGGPTLGRNRVYGSPMVHAPN